MVRPVADEIDWTKVVAWHHDLSRGERAELRRAVPPENVAFSPAFARLLNALPGLDWRRLAVVASLLARVSEHDGRRSVAAACGEVVREGRMRRLVETSVRDELPAQLGSILRLLGGTANVSDLAASVYFWGDHVRRQWAMDYYAGGRE